VLILWSDQRAPSRFETAPAPQHDLVRNGVMTGPWRRSGSADYAAAGGAFGSEKASLWIPWRITEKLDLDASSREDRGACQRPQGAALCLVGPIRVPRGQPWSAVQRLRQGPQRLFTGQKAACGVRGYCARSMSALIPYMAGDKHGRSIPEALRVPGFGKPIVSAEIRAWSCLRGGRADRQEARRVPRPSGSSWKERDEALAEKRREHGARDSWMSGPSGSRAHREALRERGLGGFSR